MGWTAIIHASPEYCQRIAGLTGVARAVIVADLAGARTIYIVSSAPVATDWERSFQTRNCPLPDIRQVDQLPTDIAQNDIAQSLFYFPGDRLLDVQTVRRLVEVPAIPRSPAGGLLIGRKSTLHASWHLIKAGYKKEDGWVSRNINRRVSSIFSHALLRWDIKPNWVTMATVLLSLMMAYALVQGGLLGLAIGGLLFQLVSIADGIDGEMARVTYQTSKFGATLDTVSDMLANILFVICLLIGLSRTYGDTSIVAAGLALATTALCITLMLILLRCGPKIISFDVLRYALQARLKPFPRLQPVIMTVEKLFRRDVYVLFAASVCVAGLAWLLPPIVCAATAIWLCAILWCAPLISADKGGRLLPDHLQEAKAETV